VCRVETSLCVCAMLVCVGSMAAAAEIHVDDIFDRPLRIDGVAGYETRTWIEDGDGYCRLNDAIIAANTDAPFDGCPAGDGDDVIVLPADTTLPLSCPTMAEFGPTSVPGVSSNITIRGNRATLSVSEGATCRVFVVHGDETRDSTRGRLRLEDLTIRGGTARGGDAAGGGGGAGLGGAVLNFGDLELERVTFEEHRAVGGDSVSVSGTSGGGGLARSSSSGGGAGFFATGGTSRRDGGYGGEAFGLVLFSTNRPTFERGGTGSSEDRVSGGIGGAHGSGDSLAGEDGGAGGAGGFGGGGGGGVARGGPGGFGGGGGFGALAGGEGGLAAGDGMSSDAHYAAGGGGAGLGGAVFNFEGTVTGRSSCSTPTPQRAGSPRTVTRGARPEMAMRHRRAARAERHCSRSEVRSRSRTWC